MNGARAPRPTDLVALVSFDDELVANEAVTRQRLGRPPEPPHPLAATMQRWLGRGRRVWIDVHGRQIQGIATARELAGREAWEIDTLADASGDGHEVTTELLRQATTAAAKARVEHLLLRMRADAPGIDAARRAGFVLALQERLWCGPPPPSAAPSDTGSLGACEVREAQTEDAMALFQLHNRALPVGTRQAVAMTFEEWQVVQDRRWTGRGAREDVAIQDGRVQGTLLVSAAQGDHGGQITLLVEPQADEVARALLRAAAPRLRTCEHVLALLPECASTPVGVLRSLGFEAGEEYLLLAARTAAIARDAMPVRAARAVVPTRG